MKLVFDGFQMSVGAEFYPLIKGSENLHRVSNGKDGICFFNPETEDVYIPKLTKVPKKRVAPEFIEQAKEEVKNKLTKQQGN